MTKQEAFQEINHIQNEYVSQLIQLMESPEYVANKAINFTSATGTGKTKMMAKLINRMPDCYFIITTLSKGQLHLQVRNSLIKDCPKENFYVYGSADYKINSKLDAEDIIGRIPTDTKCIWLRDEGHIKTNRFDELLQNVCYKVINFSATNTYSDIQCNFTQTMMLRTVNQSEGTPEDAIIQLLQVKEAHKNVPNYNPCAIFRCVGNNVELYDMIVDLCNRNALKYIDITENTVNMAELCEDDNEYDVIINKFKIVEGIDIRRAHVLYMDNQPANNATTIQVIGRCRRNALLYRHDIDILDPKNEALLKLTRECYVFYNVQQMRVDTDLDGELQYAFCNHISCESLKPGSKIQVNNGQLSNGLFVIELSECSGIFDIQKDPSIGFNRVFPDTPFYNQHIQDASPYIYTEAGKIHINNLRKMPLQRRKYGFDYSKGFHCRVPCEPFYEICYGTRHLKNVLVNHFYDYPTPIPQEILDIFQEYASKYNTEYWEELLKPAKLYGGIPLKRHDFKCSELYQNTDFVVPAQFNEPVVISHSDIENFFSRLANCVSQAQKALIRYSDLLEFATQRISDTYTSLQNNVIPVIRLSGLDKIIEPLTKSEKIEIKKKKIITVQSVKTEELYSYPNYIKLDNDIESAIVGVDLMHQIRTDGDVNWVESRSVSSKVGNYNKFNMFLSNKYSDELNQAQQQIFSGKNQFKLNKKCNSVIGYCVEYYSKYLVYGQTYLGNYIKQAQKESYTDVINDYIIIRACMLKYRDLMVQSFGSGVSRVIQSISSTQLIQEQYHDFVNLVVQLGEHTANYVKTELYPDVEPKDDVDPNLSIRHIAGLADYITHDTILDVKVRNNIDDKCVRQVLAYHYLSTKRSDLHIKRVIVYDAVSDKSVVINITPENIKEYADVRSNQEATSRDANSRDA